MRKNETRMRKRAQQKKRNGGVIIGRETLRVRKTQRERARQRKNKRVRK